MQKVMWCSTYRDSIRAEIDRWNFENGDAVMVAYRERLGGPHEYKSPFLVPVGFIGGSLGFPHYPTVLHAIGDGWKLLAPPTKYTFQTGDGEMTAYEWWLVRD